MPTPEWPAGTVLRARQHAEAVLRRKHGWTFSVLLGDGTSEHDAVIEDALDLSDDTALEHAQAAVVDIVRRGTGLTVTATWSPRARPRADIDDPIGRPEKWDATLRLHS